MQSQLVPKSIKTALNDKMAARWVAAHVDFRTAPSGGIEMCTHAASMMIFEHGLCPMPKHLKLWVSIVVLQCLARLWLG
jgi:hypothetical protein